MVESRQTSGFEKMIGAKGPTGKILIAFFNPCELARCFRLNKAFYRLMLNKNHVNFQLLFEDWGIKLTPSEVEETNTSPSRALEVAAKYWILKSIIKSPKIMAKKRNPFEKGNKSRTSVPDVKTLDSKNVLELRNLAIKQVYWHTEKPTWTLGVTLSDY